MIEMYFENHKGEKIDLLKKPYRLLTDTDIFDYSYNFEINELLELIDAELDTKNRSLSIKVDGSTESELYQNIENFVSKTDVDARNKKYGRFYVGDYYLECVFSSSSKNKKFLRLKSTTIDFKVNPKSGHWIKEKLTEYRNDTAPVEVTDGLNYPYDYTYDYTNLTVLRTLNNDTYADSDFLITIYGSCENPQISIGDWNYGANVTVGNNEKLIIDSKNKKVYIVLQNGEEENHFADRNKDFYAFEKIKTGNMLVTTNGIFEFDVLLYQDRSEPKWI